MKVFSIRLSWQVPLWLLCAIWVPVIWILTVLDSKADFRGQLFTTDAAAYIIYPTVFLSIAGLLINLHIPDVGHNRSLTIRVSRHSPVNTNHLVHCILQCTRPRTVWRRHVQHVPGRLQIQEALP